MNRTIVALVTGSLVAASHVKNIGIVIILNLKATIDHCVRETILSGTRFALLQHRVDTTFKRNLNARKTKWNTFIERTIIVE